VLAKTIADQFANAFEALGHALSTEELKALHIRILGRKNSLLQNAPNTGRY
jgi:hypothetical protein